MAMKEVKLLGKLDLSMWRGGMGDIDAEEDKDSTIDYSFNTNESPFPIRVSPNNNPYRPNSSPTVPGGIQAQTQKSAQERTNSTTSFASTSANFLNWNEEWNQEEGQKEKVQIHLPSSHNQYQIGNLNKTQENTDNGKVGVKKVEFAQDMQRKPSNTASAMSRTEKQDNGKDTVKIKGFRTGWKRSEKSPAGSLLNEIRKMSLASQDAAEDKKSGVVKKIRRVKKRRREEEYTDKDRAAAVTLGSRDIKLSLKAKKKRERKSRISLDFMSSEEYLASMLVVEALYQLKVRKTPQAALATLNKALEIQPNHKGALVARSQCHIRLGDANSALKDAETSFGKNETFIQGLYHYAEALYQMGEFEKSLIAFHQGHRLRKDMDGFRIGVQKSQEAIKRAIGDRTATRVCNMDEILSITEELQEKQKTDTTCKEEDLLVNIIMKKRQGESVNNQGRVGISNSKNRWITREVLGQLHKDKEYLAKLITRSNLSENDGHTATLLETAKGGLNYLENRERFWRQQNPLYARKNLTKLLDSKGPVPKPISSVVQSSSSASTIKSRTPPSMETNTNSIKK